MKPTVKVIVTSYNEAESLRFVSELSDIEMGKQERKVSDPFSPTKEEATLWMQVGRVEWESVVIQMQHLGTRRRYDFIWPMLLPEVYGVIVLADVQDRENWQATRMLLRLFKMMAYRNCLVAIKRAPALSAQEFRAVSTELQTEYTVTTYAPDDKESMVNVLRAWLKIVPPPDEPVRRRGRNAGRPRETKDALPSNPD